MFSSISLQQVIFRTVFGSSRLGLPGFTFETFLFHITRKFSINFKSGELPGQSKILHFFRVHFGLVTWQNILLKDCDALDLLKVQWVAIQNVIVRKLRSLFRFWVTNTALLCLN